MDAETPKHPKASTTGWVEFPDGTVREIPAEVLAAYPTTELFLDAMGKALQKECWEKVEE